MTTQATEARPSGLAGSCDHSSIVESSLLRTSPAHVVQLFCLHCTPHPVPEAMFTLPDVHDKLDRQKDGRTLLEGGFGCSL
eukprot:6474010-Amphidinium_carterae.1